MRQKLLRPRVSYVKALKLSARILERIRYGMDDKTGTITITPEVLDDLICLSLMGRL